MMTAERKFCFVRLRKGNLLIDGLIDNDIHRLVRATAHHVLVYEDRSLDSSAPTTQVHHSCDGPGL
jgi:hypothetical protein